MTDDDYDQYDDDDLNEYYERQQASIFLWGIIVGTALGATLASLLWWLI